MTTIVIAFVVWVIVCLGDYFIVRTIRELRRGER